MRHLKHSNKCRCKSCGANIEDFKSFIQLSGGELYCPYCGDSQEELGSVEYASIDREDRKFFALSQRPVIDCVPETEELVVIDDIADEYVEDGILHIIYKPRSKYMARHYNPTDMICVDGTIYEPHYPKVKRHTVYTWSDIFNAECLFNTKF